MFLYIILCNYVHYYIVIVLLFKISFTHYLVINFVHCIQCFLFYSFFKDDLCLMIFKGPSEILFFSNACG